MRGGVTTFWKEHCLVSVARSPTRTTTFSSASSSEVAALDAHAQHIADLEQALWESLVREEALLHDSMLKICALEKEMRYLREQYALLEGRYNALLEKVAPELPPPPSE
jgi:hypothetical protein